MLSAANTFNQSDGERPIDQATPFTTSTIGLALAVIVVKLQNALAPPSAYVVPPALIYTLAPSRE